MTDAAVSELLTNEAITVEREEDKYVVPSDRIGALRAELAARLPSHQFSGQGANQRPNPEHFVTTIYFDTPSRVHWREAAAHPDENVKLRAKEYYDLHRSAAAGGAEADQVHSYQPWIWLELKRREKNRTSKRRLRLRKVDVPDFFDRLAAGQPSPWPAREAEPIVDYLRHATEPLAASCLVNYRRLSWQDRTGFLRVTMDFELGFYAIPFDLWNWQHPLLRPTLGRPKGFLPAVLVEVKRRGSTPIWLEQALEAIGVEASAYSKFVQAGLLVHGSR